MVVDGARNGDLVRAYVEQPLARARRPGNIVVMGDRPSHKVAGVVAAVEQGGATLADLPPYSPDRNPIEQVFAEANGEIRRQKPRTIAGTERLCGEALAWFPARECRNYIRHAGYSPQGSNRNCSRHSVIRGGARPRRNGCGDNSSTRPPFPPPSPHRHLLPRRFAGDESKAAYRPVPSTARSPDP